MFKSNIFLPNLTPSPIAHFLSLYGTQVTQTGRGLVYARGNSDFLQSIQPRWPRTCVRSLSGHPVSVSLETNKHYSVLHPPQGIAPDAISRGSTASFPATNPSTVSITHTRASHIPFSVSEFPFPKEQVQTKLKQVTRS